MTRSRIVVLAGMVVVGVGVVGALGALYLDPARAAVGPLPAEGLALPADTRFVMGFDVQRFVASPFYQRFSKDRLSQGRPPGFGELEEKMGVNPERDVDRIVFAGRGMEKGGSDGGIILVNGRFDRTKLSRAIETQGKGVTSKSHEGTTVYLFRESSGVKASAAAFLDDDTLVLGPRESVEATITNYAGGQTPVRSNTALVALLQTVKPGSTFWAVGDQSILSRLPFSMPGPGGQSVTLPPVKSVIVTGELDPVVAVELTGEAADAKAAQSLADLVRGFVALATLQSAQKPELKDLASAVSVTTDATRVHVNLRVPYELIDSLSGKRPVAAVGTPEAR